jgi:hypothetical protein
MGQKYAVLQMSLNLESSGKRVEEKKKMGKAAAFLAFGKAVVLNGMSQTAADLYNKELRNRMSDFWKMPLQQKWEFIRTIDGCIFVLEVMDYGMTWMAPIGLLIENIFFWAVLEEAGVFGGGKKEVWGMGKGGLLEKMEDWYEGAVLLQLTVLVIFGPRGLKGMAKHFICSLFTIC